MRRTPHVVALALLAAAVAVSSASAAGGSVDAFKVTSTLDGKKVLPLRIRWKATPHIPTSQVRKVEFLVDGHWLWTKHGAPYFYGGNDGNYANWLITSFLKAGRHTFTARVFATGGTETDKVRARVIQAPAPPSELAGTWKHTVDGKTITLSITTLGWGTARDKFDARYESGGRIMFGPLVVFPHMSPGARLGGFCNALDPLHTWTYTVASDDQSFQLQPIGKDPCPDRQHGLEGTFTRVASSAALAAARSICVGSRPGCFSTIQAAVNAAQDGDTIMIAPGTYAGGVTIDKNLKLIGAGASSTTITGGGPVLTIGVAGAASEPTVSVDGVTVTGGVTVGNLDPSDGRGGGIYVPRAAGPSTGATVTIRNTVIRGNTVAPSVARDSGIPCPPDVTISCIDGDLPFASAGGGGISNDGTMTLDHTLVTDNRADAASGLTSDADGGGILDRAFGSLTLHDSVVTDNHAEVTAPNGRFVDSGGILNNGPMLTIDGSLVSNNSAQLTAAFPNSVETGANTAGVHIQGDDNCADPSEGCTVATIRDSTITGNSVTASNSLGDAVDFCGGICDDGVLTLSDSLVGTNHVTATVPSGSTACACADSAGIGTGGIESIADTRVTGNTVVASAPDGTANASSGGGSDGNDVTNTISDSVFSGNQLIATTTSGMANVQGAGFTNGAVLTIRGTTFSDNAGTATGPDGSAQGGGIWNGNQPGVLTLLDDQLIRNTLSADTGISAEGGGLFTTNPVTIKNAVIANNVPDQCFGC